MILALMAAQLWLSGRVDPAIFVRISRSSLVNLDRIASLVTNEAGESMVTLSTGEQMSLTRGVRELQARLEMG